VAFVAVLVIKNRWAQSTRTYAWERLLQGCRACAPFDDSGRVRSSNAVNPIAIIPPKRPSLYLVP
jgi:hypothetical protein